MRKIVLKIIVEVLLIIEKVKKHYKIAEWEVYNEKYWKVGKMKLEFGKYRGQEIDDIAKTKDGFEYLQWLVKQDWLDQNIYDYITCVVEV